MILDKAAAVVKKDFLTALRYRNGLLLNAFAPVAQLVVFYYLARAVGPQFRPEGMPYFLFLMVGTGLYTFLLTGMHSFFRSIQESQQSGTLEVLMTTATPAPLLLFLSVISTFAGGVVQLTLYIGVGLFLFRPPMHVNVTGCVAVFTLSFVIAVSVGMIAAGLQIAVHKGSAALWLLGSIAWVVSGTLFPITVLPRPIEVLAQFLPMTHSLTGMRLAVFSDGSPALIREIGVLVAFSVVLVPASIMFFSWTLRRARQFGTLSFY